MLDTLTVKPCKLLKVGVLAIAVALGGCNSASQTINPSTSSAASNKPPKVVATTSILCDLTKQLAANTIDLTCLVPPGTDPHLYQPKPEDRKAIESAKLILYAGYDFEPGLIKLIQATKNPAPKIAVDEVAVPNPIQTEHAHEGDEKGDTATDKEENVPDPHVWHDAQNGIRMVEVISGT
jgi:manganese/iron transport system substrate-binding protein